MFDPNHTMPIDTTRPLTYADRMAARSQRPVREREHNEPPAWVLLSGSVCGVLLGLVALAVVVLTVLLN